MSKIEIVTKETLSWNEAQILISDLNETASKNYTVLSLGVIDTPTVTEILRQRDCSKEVCNVED